MTVVLSIAAVALVVLLAIWLGHHSLGAGGPTSSSGNAFGGFDVFDPGRARGQEDLDSKETEGEALPAPNDEDVPVRVDLRSGKVHIRRTPPSA